MAKDFNKIAFIHHNADADGWVCGWIAEKIFQSEMVDFEIPREVEKTHKRVDRIGYNYGTDPLRDEWLNYQQHHYDLYIFADVTPPILWLESLFITKPDSDVLIFDHHENAYNKINALGIKRINYVYESNISAAKILFNERFRIREYFVPSKPDFSDKEIMMDNLHYLINLISDYDTWKFTHPDYNYQKRMEVLYLNEYLRTLETSTEFAYTMDSESRHLPKNYMNYGHALVKRTIKDNKIAISRGTAITINNKKGFVINAYPNYWTRDMVDEKYPGEFDFVMGLNIDFKSNALRCSVRDLSPNFNTLDISVPFGGGGHKGASGFSLPIDKLPAILSGNL